VVPVVAVPVSALSGLRGGSRGGGGERLEFRWTLRFHPEVRSDARWLRLTVTRIEWQIFDSGRPRVDRTTTGPWTFEVALP
jgi:hypothetical protein